MSDEPRRVPRASCTPLVIAAGVALLALAGSAQASVRVGQPAPPLKPGKILQAPGGEDVSWEALEGQAVVLEFWATWCGPCVQAIGHLNELDDEFDGQAVRFLSITTEDEITVGPFLAKRPMAGWVGLDTDHAVFDAYDVVALPTTVLIGPRGVVRAVTGPEQLSVEVIANLIAGRDLNLPAPATPRSTPETVLGAGSAEPLFQVSIRPSTSGDQWGQYGPAKYLVGGATIESALAFAHDVPRARVLFVEPPDATRYDIAVLAADHPELVRPLLAQALEATFHLQARRQMRERDVHIVAIAKGHEGRLQATGAGGSGFQTAFGRVEGVNMTAAQIALALESLLGSPVVDETGLTGRYDVRLFWDPDDDASLGAAMTQQLGLEWREARRSIEMLVVSKTADEAR
ncbi:MAG: TIGR03435 family protein [Acidobacteriota bacterium]